MLRACGTECYGNVFDRGCVLGLRSLQDRWRVRVTVGVAEAAC
jgi:hypothetical protein